MSRQQQAKALQQKWESDPRWKGIKRGYTAADVVRLRGSLAGPAHPRPARRGQALEPGPSTRSPSSTPSAR